MTRTLADWPAIFALLATDNDVTIAAHLGVTPQTVKAHRIALKIPRRYGRPAPKATARPRQVWTRLSEDERAALDACVRADGVTASAWVQMAIVERVERQQAQRTSGYIGHP